MTRDLDLGPLLRTYRGHPIGWRNICVFYLPGILVGIALLIFSLYRYQFAYAHYGPVVAFSTCLPWFLISSLLCLFVVVAFAIRFQQTKSTISLHQYGVTLGISPYRKRRLPYQNIGGISTDFKQAGVLHSASSPHLQATLYPLKGNPIRLPTYLQDYPDMISHIKASLYPRLLPALIGSFQANQWVKFGSISIQKQGFRLDRRYTPWKDIKQIQIQNGYLVVTLKDQKICSVPTRQIPNLELLLHIVHEVIA
jgi:hypothetical protein